MKLNYVIIYVEDVVKATEFYERAFELKTKFIHESNMYAEMESGEVVLAFAQNEMLQINLNLEAHKGIKNCFEIAFSTVDVQLAYDKAVQCGAIAMKNPEIMPWGQTVAYVQDAFGTIIEICTPMS